MYGPGGKYNLFSGKDASRALAKWSMSKEDLTDDLVRKVCVTSCVIVLNKDLEISSSLVQVAEWRSGSVLGP